MFAVDIIQSRIGYNVSLVGSDQANVVVHGAWLQAGEAQGGTVTLRGKRQVFVTALSSHSGVIVGSQLSKHLTRGKVL